jgi:hypothetical protein
MAQAFTVEDGSGISDSNAYIDIAYATQYHLDRGNDFWATTLNNPTADAKLAQCKAAIVRATFYIDKRFRTKFVGARQRFDQALAWPRIGAFDSDGYQFDSLPKQLQKACAEYALRALIYQTLAPDPLRPVPGQDMTDGTSETEVIAGQVKSKRVQVGPISESTTYESAQDIIAKNIGAGTRDTQATIMNDFNLPEYPEADLYIEELLRARTGNILLTRGS